jgi:serine/threonine protein kinase
MELSLTRSFCSCYCSVSVIAMGDEFIVVIADVGLCEFVDPENPLVEVSTSCSVDSSAPEVIRASRSDDLIDGAKADGKRAPGVSDGTTFRLSSISCWYLTPLFPFRLTPVWAYGVILFELLFWRYPFPRDSRVKRAQNNLPQLEISFPGSRSSCVGDLCEQTLRELPSERLSASAILTHEWFS